MAIMMFSQVSNSSHHPLGDKNDKVDVAIEAHHLPVLSLDSRPRLIQKLKTPQPKRIFVGTLCPVLFLTATTNQLDLIGPEWNGKKMGGT